jgi:hypothetical protein
MDSWFEIKKAIDRLDGKTAKSCLGHVLDQIRRLKEQSGEAEDAISGLIRLYDRLTSPEAGKDAWAPHPECTHVHVVTGESFAGSMKLALKELGLTETHSIVVLGDDYAIGPIGRLDTPEGRRARNEWFWDHIAGALEEQLDIEETYRKTLERFSLIPGHSEILVWASRSVREQIGMRHALHLLRGKPNPIRILDACAMCEQRYNRPDDSITYRRSGEIPPDKLQEVFKVVLDFDAAGRLAADDVARFAGEWLSIAEQGGVLRIWQDGAVQEVPADYFDRYLLEKLEPIIPPAGDNGFVKCARLVGEALGHCEQDIDSAYFEYRIRELVCAGFLEIKGVPAGMRHYSVRRKPSA